MHTFHIHILTLICYATGVPIIIGLVEYGFWLTELFLNEKIKPFVITSGTVYWKSFAYLSSLEVNIILYVYFF